MEQKGSLDASTDTKDPTAQLESIFDTITKTLRSYDEMVAKNKVLDLETIQKFRHSMVTANDSLEFTEGSTFLCYKNFEELTNWISDLRYQQDTFFQMSGYYGNKPEVGNFMLSYNKKSNKLREIQKIIIKKFRDIIKTYETPQSARLSALKAEVEHSYNTRLKMIKTVTRQMDETSDHLIESAKKNGYLLYEMEKTEKELQLFGEDNSYDLVLKARKQKLMEKEWKIKKAILMNDIEKTQKELDSFRNAENTTSELKKLLNEQEQEIKQIANHYAEEIRQVETEINIDINSHKSNLDQINKELNNSRNDRIKQEKFETMGQLKSKKIIGDRTLNGIKKRRMATLKGAEKKLKKSKNINEAIEIASAAFEIDKRNSNEICEIQISELKEILERFQNTFIEAANVKIKEIERMAEQAQMICKANKDRFAEKTVQRELEADSINRNIVLIESMIADLELQLIALQKENEQKEMKLKEMALSKESKVGEISKEIIQKEEFIKRAKIIIDALQLSLKSEFEKKDGYLRVRINKRSNSALVNTISLSDLMKFINERTKECSADSDLKIDSENFKKETKEEETYSNTEREYEEEETKTESDSESKSISIEEEKDNNELEDITEEIEPIKEEEITKEIESLNEKVEEDISTNEFVDFVEEENEFENKEKEKENVIIEEDNCRKEDVEETQITSDETIKDESDSHYAEEDLIIPVREPEPNEKDYPLINKEEVSLVPKPPTVRPESARRRKGISREPKEQPEKAAKKASVSSPSWAPTMRLPIRSRAPLFHERAPTQRTERIRARKSGMRTTADALKEPPKGTPILFSVRPFGQSVPSHRELYELGVVNHQAKLKVGNNDTGKYRFLLLATDNGEQNTKKHTYVRVSKKIQKP